MPSRLLARRLLPVLLLGLVVAPACLATAGPAAGSPGQRPAKLPLTGAAEATPSSGYRWPTGGEAEVLRAFEPPSNVWGPGHRGVDLAHRAGAAVLAANDGVVAFAGVVVDRPVVSVQHADGIRTTYEPVRPAVSPGEAVRAGQTIGHLEQGHCAAPAPACLHFGARTGPDAYIDPLSLLGSRPVIRLLPLG